MNAGANDAGCGVGERGSSGRPGQPIWAIFLKTSGFVGGCIKRAIASGKLAQKYVKLGREYLVLTDPHTNPNGKVAAELGDPR